MRATILATTIGSLLSFQGCIPPEQISYLDDFEFGLLGWTSGADVPDDPNNPGETVAWSIAASTEQADRGSVSAKFTLDGRQDDGTIWLARPFVLSPYTDYDVTLTFALWSETPSDNALAAIAAYAGAVEPTVEADFDVSKTANEAAGWKEYTYTFHVRSSPTGRVWVAFGISAVWETELLYYIDSIEVYITPS